MLVYGIRCSPSDLFGIRVQANADYYTDYSLLVFPGYTKPLCLDSHGALTSEFWDTVRLIAGKPKQVRVMDFEQPYITETEAAVVTSLQESYPGLQPDWYYVPRTHA
jgi:hypothetical protein